MFSLEEDACASARAYLEELSFFYSKIESGSEIMEGIEERMSELMVEQAGLGGVVTLPMVERVIATLGRPEAIEEGSDSEDGTRTGSDGASSRHSRPDRESPRRKLYRDPVGGKLAGVCSGLGIYFDMDPAIFRIIFVVLGLVGCGFLFHRGGFVIPDYLSPLVYAILWICMPVARTVRQKDEQRGVAGTVDAISARIQSTAREMGDVAGTVVRSSVWSDIWRIFAVCLGILLLVTGASGLVTLGCLSIGDNVVTNSFFYNRLLEDISTEAPLVLEALSYPPLVIALAVSAVVPFIAMLYFGVLLLFDLKSPKWHPGVCLLVIWLIAVAVLAILVTLFLARGI